MLLADVRLSVDESSISALEPSQWETRRLNDVRPVTSSPDAPRGSLRDARAHTAPAAFAENYYVLGAGRHEVSPSCGLSRAYPSWRERRTVLRVNCRSAVPSPFDCPAAAFRPTVQALQSDTTHCTHAGKLAESALLGFHFEQV